MKYVLVTGFPSNAITAQMEVMDYDETAQMEVMDENGSTKICKNPKSKYPLQVYSATGVYTEGRMIVCGGTTNVKSRLTSACYSYEDDQQGWTKLADMNTQRSSSSSIKIPGGILVTGGFDGGSKDLKTSEIIFINGTVKQGKELPEPRSGHCMVEYQGQIISTGGYDGNDDVTSDVWSFNNHEYNNEEQDLYHDDYAEGVTDQPETGLWPYHAKPSMKYTRAFHACGIVHSKQHQGRPLLVVAGSNDGGAGFDQSEYLDWTKAGSQWQLCTLPAGMDDGPKMTTTKNKNQLLMTFKEDVYSFNCRSSDDCYWKKKNQELKTARFNHVLMEVPASLVENC